MRAVLLLLLLTAVAGCQTTTTTPQKRGTPARSDGALPGPLRLDDPCAEQLHNLIGPLLQFYVLNRRLPATLEEVKLMGDLLTPVELNCPESKQPYVYVPNGLAHEKHAKLIIVHDAAASHRQRRWCITIAPYEPGQPITLEVIDVPEVFFRTYKAVE